MYNGNFEVNTRARGRHGGGDCSRLPPGGPLPVHTAAPCSKRSRNRNGCTLTTRATEAAWRSVMGRQSSVPSKTTGKLPREKTPIKKDSEVAQSCLTLCDPIDCSLPGSSVHGIFQARVLECGAISFSRGSSWPRDRTCISHIVGRCFTIWPTRETF